MAKRRPLTAREAYEILESGSSRPLSQGELNDVLALVRASDELYRLFADWKAERDALQGEAWRRVARELDEQMSSARRKGVANSVRARRQKTIERDRRIHDARTAGKSHKAIALDEGVSESVVSRVLKKPRP